MKIGLLGTLSAGDRFPMKIIEFMRFRMRWLLRLVILTLVVSGNSYAEQEGKTPKPTFKLTKGQGTEVCEAYLQRLQATEFVYNDPTKGRLNEPQLKGFADLKTEPLTLEEVLRLYNKLKSFEQYQDQNLHDNYYEKFNALHKHETKFKPEGQGYLYSIKKSMVEHNQKPFVRYQALLDLDNDGKASDTVIKATNDKDHFSVKGLFIVDDKLQRVEEARMKAIFADQEILQWPSVTQFPPLASSIDVFNYNGKTYFDGLLDVVLSTDFSPTVNRYSPVMMGVFIHERSQTQKICEYQWVNGKVYPRIEYKYEK
jgi:hypothetical protein